MAKDSYSSALKQITKMNNDLQLKLQKMTDKTNLAQMKYNSAEAKAARDWQQHMSETAHQMEVKDLKAAGLNPVLSANSNGAQSYTTSSASASPESGAAALASIGQAQLGAIGNMESSRISANANLKAAQMNARAVQQAAETSAAAQKYASDRSYFASLYKTDKEFETQARQRQLSKWQTKNATAGSWAGIIDKFMRNSGLADFAYKNHNADLATFLKGKATTVPKDMRKYPSDYFVQGKKANNDNFKLTSAGYRSVASALQNYGFTVNRKSVNAYVHAVVFHDKNYLPVLMKYYKNPVGKNKVDPFKVAPGYR